ncbi:MotA/TolQ/ExbB proton channel family protein [Novosphingobium colocasiae]
MTNAKIFRAALVPALTCAGLVAMPAIAAAEPVVPANLSVGAMFVNADWIVKLVMIGLIAASLVTWTVFFAKLMELRRATAAARHVLETVSGMRSLVEATRDAALLETPLVREAISELRLSSDALNDAEGVKERVLSRFSRHEAAVARDMTRGVSILATIGATAPFVGLFGTVWGIMNSFVGIAEKADH